MFGPNVKGFRFQALDSGPKGKGLQKDTDGRVGGAILGFEDHISNLALGLRDKESKPNPKP